MAFAARPMDERSTLVETTLIVDGDLDLEDPPRFIGIALDELDRVRAAGETDDHIAVPDAIQIRPAGGAGQVGADDLDLDRPDPTSRRAPSGGGDRGHDRRAS